MYINFLCGIETASYILQYSIHVMNMCIHVLTLIPPFVGGETNNLLEMY